jgi:homocysteine S-methyltransferase
MEPRDPFETVGDVVVLDGGLATELERRGADLRDPLWSAKVLVEEPSRIVDAHRAYVAAGADVLITASYQASFEGFSARGYDRDTAAELFARSVELARAATEDADRPVLVAASVGPYGAMLANGAEYTGDYGFGGRSRAVGALRDFHGPRIEVLAAAGPDLLALETIPSIEEAEALTRVLASVDVPAWVSFSCRDDRHLSDGTPFVDAVDVVAGSEHVIAVGVNCTPPAFVPALLEDAAAHASTRLVAYPNRGASWDAAAQAWTGDAVPDGFGPLAVRLREAGASLIGGCCGSTADDIVDVARALRPVA